jgi:hypothetical protein
MLSNSNQSPQTVMAGRVSSAREIEFAEALDRYMANYRVDSDQPRRQRTMRNADGTPAVLWHLAGFIIVALELLGGAMSAGGRYPPVGIM